MKLKLSLQQEAGRTVDLLVTLDATTTVGQLAAALHQRDPRRRQASAGPLTLERLDERPFALTPSQTVTDSGLVSGATVRLSAAVAVDAPRRAAAAVLRVLEGPDSGREFPLATGASVIGRASSCEVRLSDVAVSREHAKVHVAETVDIVDLGSANGVDVGGELVQTAVLRPRDRVKLGDSVLSVEMLGVGGTVLSAGSPSFNRSPRLGAAFRGIQIDLPEPPQRGQKPRFPLLVMLAPLAMGGMIFVLTRNVASIAFVALSPLMAVANVVEQRVAAKRGYRAGAKEWNDELVELKESLAKAAVAERESRLQESPSAADVRQAARERTSLLWCRRPIDEAFLELRLGLGSVPTRSTVTLPSGKRTDKASWMRLEDFQREASVIEDCPIGCRLTDTAVGVAGPRRAVVSSAYALVQQVVGLHSPAEVVLAAVLSADGLGDWDWLPWLPHATSAHSPLECRQLAGSAAAAALLLAELESLLQRRKSGDVSTSAPHVVVLVEDDAAVERARLVALASAGAAAGIHVIWLSPSVERLPAPCSVFLDLGNGGTTVGFTTSGHAVEVRPDVSDGADAAAMARALSPLVDSGAPVDDDSDLPRSVSWLSLHDPAMATDSSAVLERWRASRSVMTGPAVSRPDRKRRGSLRAVLGSTAGAPHTLDLRTHGPHALVGGTTGSGKSELLQSWILSLAAMHSPQRVTFLLVDYKGGSAFRECLSLPHTVGLVTDLGPQEVRRALVSLSAELRFREQLLAKRRKKDLLELEDSGDPETPPSLVIVVDEFAALVQDVPEFVDGVINVAQRGRSLGLHLVLATQRPAGVINDNLRANTNLRIALRVADANDSTDVVGSPVAGSFDPELPGRAVSKTGPGKLTPFQSAYAGGWTSNEPVAPTISVQELGLGQEVVWEEPEVERPEPAPSSGPSDISRVVKVITEAANQAELPAPRRPWLPELSTTYDLTALPTAMRDDELVFGVADHPAHQAQPTVSFSPDVDGNLIVFGTGGSGKSALLRTFAIAAGFTRKGGPCHVYGLDFGARGLDMLEPLPHVGGIIPGSDFERITRLLGTLRALIDDRAARYARAKAGTITEFRKLAGEPGEHRVLLLVDGIGAFRTAFESAQRIAWFELFQSIAADGRPVGVHVVMSADRAGALPASLGAVVQRRIILRLADESDYAMVGAPSDVLRMGSPPGRGLLDGTEIQVAVLGGDRSTLTQSRAIAGLATSMSRAGVARAPVVRRLPEHLILADLPERMDDRPVIGMASATLQPCTFDPSGAFLITGPPGSGRTTALATAVAALRRFDPRLQVHLMGPRRSTIARTSGLASVSTSPEEAASTAERLAAVLQGGNSRSRLVLVLEQVADLVTGPADTALQQLVKALLADDHVVIAEGETSTLSMGGGLLGMLKVQRTGIALQPDMAEASVFRTEFPRLRRPELPPGRALLVQSGRSALVQVAIPAGEGSAPHSLPV